jgi:hypothetical protein
VPLRLTVRHYFDFGEARELVGDDLVRPDAWDALRTDTSGPFAAPQTRADAERVLSEHPEISARAEAIDGWLTSDGAASVASYGVGGATLELCLHDRAPQRALVLGEYAPRTVERLRTIFPEPEVAIELHDLLADPPLPADVHLLHRVDTEMRAAQWRGVLRRFATQRILFVAAGMVDVAGAMAELRKGLRKGATKAGWVRTRPALEALWRDTHVGRPIAVGDLPAWVLEPRA